MKKQMKSSLFILVFGCSIVATLLISATGNTTKPATNQQPALQEQKPSAPAVAPVAAEPSKIPFTFYLTLVTTFTNGGSIDFDLVGEEGQSFIWNEMPEWGKDH